MNIVTITAIGWAAVATASALVSSMACRRMKRIYERQMTFLTRAVCGRSRSKRRFQMSQRQMWNTDWNTNIGRQRNVPHVACKDPAIAPAWSNDFKVVSEALDKAFQD